MFRMQLETVALELGSASAMSREEVLDLFHDCALLLSCCQRRMM